jgi:hypothetical protein
MHDDNFKLKILLLHLKTESTKTEQREDSNYRPPSMSLSELAHLINIRTQNKPNNCAATHQYLLKQA